MLKLEKKSRSSNVTIRLRAQESFFEPILLKSLACALLIHIFAYVLFQITPFHFSSEYTFPPTQAISHPEYVTCSQKITTSLEENELFFPLPSLMPNLTLPSTSQKLTFNNNEDKTVALLEKLERGWPPATYFSLPLDVKEPSIHMDISGDLADQKLLTTDPMLLELQPVNYKAEFTTVAFSVRLNPWDGQLFWIAAEEPHENKEIQKKAEEILAHIKFEPPLSKEELTGKITFTFLSNHD